MNKCINQGCRELSAVGGQCLAHYQAEIEECIFKIGDIVKYKEEIGNVKYDNRTYVVYGLYPNNQVSLGLYEYPDTEQDETINADELIKV